jgi:hypothetical protein
MIVLDSSRSRLVGLLWLASVAVALISSRLTAEDYPSEVWSAYPSESWSPYPSDTWSPRIASLPAPPSDAIAPAEIELPAPATSSIPDAETGSPFEGAVFGPPPIEVDGWQGPAVIGAAPQQCAPPPSEYWQPHSSFMPSLCRYGLIAPRTPGLNSVHSAYDCAPSTVPPSPCANLFGPPPCIGCESYTLPQPNGAPP